MHDTQRFSTGEVARMIGVKPFILEYHIQVGHIREPAVRFLGKRCFSPEEMRTAAAYFGKEQAINNSKKKGEEGCSQSNS